MLADGLNSVRIGLTNGLEDVDPRVRGLQLGVQELEALVQLGLTDHDYQLLT